jgi:hypothetical protein
MENWRVDHYENIKPATKSRYEGLLKIYILPHFGKRDIRDISRAEILKFLKGLKSKGKSASTIQMAGY